ISSFQGAQPAEQLRRWIDSLLAATAGKLSGAADSEPAQVDPGLAKARELLDAGNFDAALGAYRAILDKDPAHPEAKGAVRQISFLTRATKQRPDASRAADAAPGDIEAAFAAADVEILDQQPDAAFNRLIDLVRRTSGDEKSKVRTRLVELFRREPQRRQGRQHHHGRGRPPVARLVDGLDGTEVAHPGPVVDIGVGVQHIAPAPQTPQPQPRAPV